MSTNDKNTFRTAVMRNFTTDTIDRYIMIDNETMEVAEQDKFINEINEKLWEAIQEVNALAKQSILPYVKVRRVIKDNTKLRIIINEVDSKKTLSEYEATEELNISELSHLIIFKTLTPQRRVVVSDDFIPGNAKMFIDEHDQIAAAVDIFLDIAMFNSISYLRELSLVNKQKINDDKFEFSKKEGLKSYYMIDENSPPSYFSFAYAARKSASEIDYEQYTFIWEKFLKKYFGEEKSFSRKPYEQLEFHIDVENIADNYFKERYWKNFEHGDYLFLRTNSTPNSNERKEMLCNYFGIESYRVGEVKIVPMHEYFRPFLRKQMQELLVSAFKIVV